MIKIQIEIQALDELKDLLDQAEDQIMLLHKKLDQIEAKRRDIQVKINQPTAGTEG